MSHDREIKPDEMAFAGGLLLALSELVETVSPNRLVFDRIAFSRYAPFFYPTVFREVVWATAIRSFSCAWDWEGTLYLPRWAGLTLEAELARSRFAEKYEWQPEPFRQLARELLR